MMRITSVVALFPDLPQTELVSWVERGWVRPEGTEPDWISPTIDVARVRLIYDFGRAMAVPEETMPLVLSCSTRSTPSAARCAPSLGPWRASRRRYGTPSWQRSEAKTKAASKGRKGLRPTVMVGEGPPSTA